MADLTPEHPRFTRRTLLEAGSIGLLGLGMHDLPSLSTAHAGEDTSGSRGDARSGGARSVIYIFLSGGLGQHDSFDMKPNAPDDIRGEFQPIQTKTTGIHICEYLPRLAARSDKWALVRSLTHPSNDHSLGHHIMLTGRSVAPPAFNPSVPQPSDFPSLTSIAGRLATKQNNLPAAAVLPFNYIHHSGRIIPGQFAASMGQAHDPWLIQASHNCPGYGACPNCFDHERRPNRQHVGYPVFEPPNLRLPESISDARLGSRRGLLEVIERQQRRLDHTAAQHLTQQRASAWSLLTSNRVRAAFDLSGETDRMRDAYGRNLFGWSCLLSRRLVESGVRMVQINLGRNETWDTHGNAFPHLKDNLFPPMDRCVSTLIDDLDARGLLDSTLIVAAGEFGRTPRVSRLPQFYALPGRDHWGAVQTVFLAGGGMRGGTVVGSSDRIGAYPATSPQTPENLAATIYHTLGLPRDAAWLDPANRPHFIYHAEPIGGL